ncbi:MAG: sugar ABC transporter permease [Leptolinea sp.]|nr:sugar ABC transporter permease [Leptolinea sp.]
MNAHPTTLPTLLAGAATRRKIRINSAYLFITPSMLIIAIFVLYPILQALWMSFHSWSFLDPERTFIGLKNYFQLFQDDRFWNSLRVSAIYTFVTVPTQIVLSILVALALHEKLRGVKLLRSIYFFPVISSFAVMAIVWSFLLDPDMGLVSHWLIQLGLPSIDWLHSTTWALPAVMFTGIWKNLGFSMVILLAGLEGIPEIYYEAASIDGAGKWSRFWNITIPGMRQGLLFVTVTSFISSLQAFDQIYVMTQGGPLFQTETIVTYMYHEGFQLYQMGYASAIAWVLFIIVMIWSVIQMKFFRYQDVD